MFSFRSNKVSVEISFGSTGAVAQCETLGTQATNEQELIPTGKKTASPEASEAGCLQSALERKLTAGVRSARSALQQLLPVLAQVDSGTLCGIRL
jgi:hypothetical protein